MIKAILAAPVVAEDAFVWLAGRKERLRKYGLAGALLFFIAGLIWAIQAAPAVGTVRIAPLLLLLVLSAPAGTVLNAIELHALSRIAGGPMKWRTAVELTVYTSAANMLPVPGGVLTKLAGMKAHGVGYATASAMIFLSFAAWGGFSFLYSGAALYLLGKTLIAGLFGVCAVVLLAICVIGFARYRNWRQVAVVAAIRMVYFVIEAFRYMLALAAVGTSLGFLQCSTLVLASFIGATVVIAPQGLGVIEAAAALLATVIGVNAGLGFIAAAVGRIARMIGLAVITGMLLVFDRKLRTRGANGSHSGSA